MLELFELESVRTLIKFKWPIIKQKIYYFGLLPFFGYLTTTVYYTQNILHAKVNGHEYDWIEDLILVLVMWVFSLYFLILEVLQMQ